MAVSSVSAAGALRAAAPPARSPAAIVGRQRTAAAAPRPQAPGVALGRTERSVRGSVSAAAEGKALNKKDLVKMVAAEVDLPEKTVDAVVSATLASIIQQVAAGEKITVTGFGSFAAKTRAARVGRNPRTGEPLQLAEKQYPAFTAGKTFKDTVAESPSVGN